MEFKKFNVPSPKIESKYSYNKIKNAVHKCELDKAEKGINNNCKAIFKEAGIDIED
jgi:hypothetical protein